MNPREYSKTELKTELFVQGTVLLQFKNAQSRVTWRRSENSKDTPPLVQCLLVSQTLPPRVIYEVNSHTSLRNRAMLFMVNLNIELNARPCVWGSICG